MLCIFQCSMLSTLFLIIPTYLYYRPNHICAHLGLSCTATLLNLRINLLTRCGDIELNPGPKLTLNICHLNARSILAYNDDCKIAEIQSLAEELEFDIISISETWLTNSTPNHLIHIQGFQKPVRKDAGCGAGVAVYFSNNVAFKPRPDLESHNIQSLWFEVYCKTAKPLLFSVYYRPPGQLAVDRNYFIETFSESLGNNTLSQASCTLIMGDFNDRCPTWSGDHSKSELKYKLVNTIDDYGFTQLIDQPTRILSDGSMGNCLDLIITDNPSQVKQYEVLSPILNNDHCVTWASISITPPSTHAQSRTIWDLEKGDYENLIDAL